MVLNLTNLRKEHHPNQQRHLMKNNPAKLPKNEINSGKIWSLLRFNEEFGKDIDWFSERYKRSKNKRLKQENRETALTDCRQKYEEINKINPFAGIALQWMFPMPIFTKENSDEVHSHPLSWGPVIWPVKGDKIDVIAEWKEYEAGENRLTLKTDWHSANEGFKRDFMYQYRQFDSRPLNPITKDRSDAPFPHETDFFNDLDLGALISQGDLNEEGLAKVLRADELKNKYRVFAVPRHLPTKKAVDDAFKTLIKSVKVSFPAKASERFGTNVEWEDFMLLKKIQAEKKNCTKKEVIVIMAEQRTSLYLPSEGRRTYETRIKLNINSVEDKIFRCYPNFHF
jgi:hypothetical protein